MNYRCPKCGESYSNSIDFIEHMESEHGFSSIEAEDYFYTIFKEEEE